MPGLLLHYGALMMCAHPPGLVTVPAPVQQRVLVGPQPVLTSADQFLVAGCSFPAVTVGAPPCVSITWLQPSTRVFVNGLPVLLQPTPVGVAPAIGVGTPPPNPPTVLAMQFRVQGM
ncbi:MULTISPECIES: hypothetical protein [Streptomyces]|jgi:hypothetical protein|uniref:hypothetical protein n=1 Tax=Streptomyces TaxID=1883 RepID=UPI000909912B|nr:MULTISPECIES: hypothetical protein [unclassified Streptomyces]MDX2681621.1 hypothetical protein [Streptomyces sp. NY05-11A]SHI50303.1 hypothetical protein SAMN05444521_7725 [Streptomyces sp. 3214.6]